LPAARGPSPGTLMRTLTWTSPAAAGARSVHRTSGSSPQTIQHSGFRVAPSSSRASRAGSSTFSAIESRWSPRACHSLSRMRPPDPLPVSAERLVASSPRRLDAAAPREFGAPRLAHPE
jgi:hypothetical protein